MHGWNRGLVLSICLLLAPACATPELQVADPSTLLKGELAFLTDGLTTREEVLLHLGIPSGYFEGERILAYALRADTAKTWHVGTRPPPPPGGFQSWTLGTGSLVLVFGPEGILLRHSVVLPQ